MPKLKPSEKKRAGFFTEAYEWVGTVVIVLAAFVLIFTLVFREVDVSGNSMLDTLHSGDRLVICDLGYTPKADDIVVVYAKNLRKTLVKRVVAVGGQTVNIDYAAHRVYVDGVLQKEPFIKDPTAFMGEQPRTPMPVKVPPGCVFVMGDNRNDSVDSRSGVVGMIKTRFVLGWALLCYYPAKDVKLLGLNRV